MKRSMTPPSRRVFSPTAPLLLLLATNGVHADSSTWRMQPVTSYQARVETNVPVWNKEHAVWVSGAPGNLTFEEQYAATLDSVTTSSVEGALMYLQRDCIDIGVTPWASKGTPCQRKNDVKVITFLEVQIANPNAALAEYQNDRYTYPEFCPFVEMKDGACIYTNDTVSPVTTITHPAECKQYNGIDGQPKIGPCVGAEAFPTDNVAPYFDTVWFSYPNSCVMNTWNKDGVMKTPTCRTQYPGGLCPFGTVPDGVNCQFSYKILGYIKIDDLVGITSMTATNANSTAVGDDVGDAASEAASLVGRNVLANPGLDSLPGSKGMEEAAEAEDLDDDGSGSTDVSVSVKADDNDGDGTPQTNFGSWTCRKPGSCYKNFKEFCEANNTEFHSTDKDRTLGLSAVTSIEFWGFPSDHRVNKNRTAFMIHMYNKQVDTRNKVSEEKMTKLPTTNQLADVTKKNPPCYRNSLTCSNAHFGCQRHSYAQVCSVCREMGAKCVTRNPTIEFPTLARAPRTVPDSALRSKVVKAPNAKAANGATSPARTCPQAMAGLVVAAIVVALAM